MSVKSRLIKLEKDGTKSERLPTWRNFISGEFEPDPKEWADFVGTENGSPISEIKYPSGKIIKLGIDVSKV